jgi:hypothetical protein
MTKQSTALLTVGPRSIPPWNDRLWRIIGTANLVEGSIPYWIVGQTEQRQYGVSTSYVEVVSPHPEAVVDSILMILGVYFGGNEVGVRLMESHNMTEKNGVRESAPFYELADETRRVVASLLSESLRLGLTRLDEFSLVDYQVFHLLREMGFDLDTYSLESRSPV